MQIFAAILPHLPYVLGAVLLLSGLAYALAGRRPTAIRLRLDEVLQLDGHRPLPVHDPARRNENLQKRLREAEKRAEEGQKRRSLKEQLAEAGFEIEPKQFYLISAAAALLLAGLAHLLVGVPILTLSFLLIGGLGLPKLVVKIAANKRRTAFLRALPDALEAIVRAIKSGQPISEALSIVARDFEGPIAEEFSRAFDEQKLGLPLAECLLRLSERMPLAEMRMMAMAVSIQMQTGGSLAETLSNLSNVIRGRERLARKVKAVSSEARVSALIMGCLPLFIMASLGAINPDYIGLLWEDPLGRVMTAFCVFWMSLGVVVMWKMVNFKV